MIQRMPRLLDGAMQARERLNPVRANVQMNLTPLSTASLTLPPDDPEISARDFVAVYAPDESYGVYRVTSIRTVYGDQRQVTLEEGIRTLEDDLTAEDTVLNGGMQAVLETLLAFQTNKRWVLGTVASEAQFTDVEAARVNVLEAVLQAVATDDTVMLVRDYSSTPWVLSVVKKPEAVSCECRLNRNLNNVTATLDDSALCTRVTVVPDEGDPITKDADTVNTWGVVHREITVEEGKDPEAEARKYLEAHKNPALSVECDALALAELTGEDWDSFALGQLCAVALPDFGAVLRDRVVSLYYPDLFGDPRHVRLTLSSQVSDASSALASLGAATNNNNKGLGRAFKHIKETENAVYIQAEQIMLRATKAEVAEINGVLTDKISNVAVELDATNATLRLKANQEYVDQQFSATELLLDGANARIEANALRIDEANKQISAASLAIDGANARIDAEAKRIDEANGEISSAKLAIDGANAAITAEVTRATEAEGELTGKLSVTTEAITAEVTRATGAETGLAGRIKVTEDSITEQAGQISAQGKLIEGAQEQIDGINARITDFATHTEVTDLGKTVNTVSETLDAVKGEVATKVSQETFDELGNRVSDAESSITQHADEISQRVKKGDIASEINQTPQGVLISASKIDLKGYVTASSLETDYLEAIRGKISDLTTGNLRATNLSSDGFTGDHMQLAGNATIEGDLTIHGFDFDAHRHQIVDNEDGTFSIGNPGWANINSFKIADTKTYKDGVSAAKNSVTVSGAWSGGVYTARTDAEYPQSTSTYISGTATAEYDETNHRYNLEAPVMASGGPGTPGSETGYIIKGVTGTEAYDDGYSDGRASGTNDVTMDNGRWSSGIFTVRMTDKSGTLLGSTTTQISGSATPAYDSATHKYTITAPVKYGPQGQGDTGYTITGSTGTEAYEAGTTAGANGVTLDSGTWSGGRFTVKASNGKSATTQISGGTSTITYNTDEHTYTIDTPVMYGDRGQGSTGYIITRTTNTEAYEAGLAAGGANVDIDRIRMGWSSQNPSFETLEYTLTNDDTWRQRSVPSPAWGAVEVATDGITAGTYQPSIAPKSLTVNVKLTNGKGGSKALDVTDVYDKGYADGKEAASGNVTVDSISDVTYNADNKNFTITIKLSNGTESKKIIDGLDAYNAGKKSVVVSDYEWTNPAKGWVRFEFTLSNDLVRGYSKEVPSKWM